MKKSNILIIGLLAITLLFVVGSNLVLKAEFEKIDQSDPFYGYKRETLKPFSFVKIAGKQIGVTQIQSGADFKIFYNAERKMLDWKINGDTLELRHIAESDEYANSYYDFDSKPIIYVTAPQLSGIDVAKTVNIVKGFQIKSLDINQNGNSTLLTDNTIDNLSAKLIAGGYLVINAKNKIGTSHIQVKDSSQLSTEKDVFKSFQVGVDSLAKIKLPGSLYRKINL